MSDIQPTQITDGLYYTTTQAAAIRKVTRKAVSLWIKKKQLASLMLANGDHLIEAETLRQFAPPPMGKPRK